LPYRSSVITALAWPSIDRTAFTCTPAAMASDAAVCRSSCGVSPGTPARAAARSKQQRRQLPTRSRSPRADEKTSLCCPSPATWMVSSSRRNLGIGTERTLCAFGDPSEVHLDTVVDDLDEIIARGRG
jgi:hypothetical protein